MIPSGLGQPLKLEAPIIIGTIPLSCTEAQITNAKEQELSEPPPPDYFPSPSAPSIVPGAEAYYDLRRFFVLMII